MSAAFPDEYKYKQGDDGAQNPEANQTRIIFVVCSLKWEFLLNENLDLRSVNIFNKQFAHPNTVYSTLTRQPISWHKDTNITFIINSIYAGLRPAKSRSVCGLVAKFSKQILKNPENAKIISKSKKRQKIPRNSETKGA